MMFELLDLPCVRNNCESMREANECDTHVPARPTARNVHVPVDVEIEQLELGEGTLAQRLLLGGDQLDVGRGRIHAQTAEGMIVWIERV